MTRIATRAQGDPTWYGVIRCDRDGCPAHHTWPLVQAVPERPQGGHSDEAHRAAVEAHVAELRAQPLPQGWLTVDGLAERPQVFCGVRCGRLYLQTQEKRGAGMIEAGKRP